MMSPIAYLTCELKGRDFESRLLIAAELIKLGYYVVVGQYWGLIFAAPAAPRGCYLFKTANNIQADAMQKCAGLGHKVVAADEEALPWVPALAPANADARTFDYCDSFLALNAAHAQAVEAAFPMARGKTTVSGTARMDLLLKTRTARPKPEPYILFNLGFGFINSLWGDLDKAVQIYVTGSRLDLTNPAHKALPDDRLAFEKAAFRETEALIDRVEAETDVDLVVRPHPSERAEFWQEKYRDRLRVTVVSHSDPIPWIQHAKLMVHSDSSTGLEAAVLGTPALNLSPSDPWAERLILRTITPGVATASEAAAAIAAFCRGDRTGAAFRARRVQDLFPPDGAKATAQTIARLLPEPGGLAGIKWERLNRSAAQREKFTVSADEAEAAMTRIFAMAGVPPKPMFTLDDSVFAIAPD
ncbi:MAG: hypothetical protein K1X51_13615 [Rhodospirillaceae bacterium]|nr:hypothetical protein [Rhodospirillaceae bacterium]